ncbi:hypothetical protein KHC23_07980 [Ancylobacter dichloromethanicus]|uniref:Uncharacterized protein n=1 Tax=Ancylobacter dichloromethanicus TaxID=518825 RepID=A0A9W6J879_9HYPH|nr:hypothetical protein [Ancylobacter dichloromethanicus]MBS7553586.1 hypothetical protein [Ancylobacter dichloromethanicus]GLK72646.1 hypothetical protein GCM10017643_27620 [Ancylobacter dichloromethanicus]
MLQAEFDVVTLSPSTVRVMHRVAHHIYEFALVDDGSGRRVVRRGPQVTSGRGDDIPAMDLLSAAEQVAAATARHTGMID